MLRRCGAGLAAAAARGLRLDGGAAAPAVASASASASAAGQPPHCGACGACGALPCGCARGTSTPVRGMATSRRVASLEKQRADARRNKPYRIVSGDTVIVRTGKEKGKTGVVKEVLRAEMRVVIEGLNRRKKYLKSNTPGRPNWVEVEMPMAYSNVALVDPLTNKAVRVRWHWDEEGNKTRLTVGRNASGTHIARPSIEQVRERLIKRRWGEEGEPDRSKLGELDTSFEEVLRPTYTPPAVDEAPAQDLPAGDEAR